MWPTTGLTKPSKGSGDGTRWQACGRSGVPFFRSALALVCYFQKYLESDNRALTL
jgi:hypothetical protein